MAKDRKIKIKINSLPSKPAAIPVEIIDTISNATSADLFRPHVKQIKIEDIEKAKETEKRDRQTNIITIELPKELNEQLNDYCKNKTIKKAEAVKKAIEKLLWEQEYQNMDFSDILQEAFKK